MALGMRSWAAKRRGPNYKATCEVCGKGIANRMLYKPNSTAGYRHTSCVPKGERAEWERCW